MKKQQIIKELSIVHNLKKRDVENIYNEFIILNLYENLKNKLKKIKKILKNTVEKSSKMTK